ncbi:hypothetical protein WOLCODRAFT_168110 [Wolfiporia cocos MD-104 SS10]|uniref:Uncharacterized protein n=1 Tax=Wolfiporia cocos (strain MD-104) TaxID=742152 RepID=A0A2H3K1V3_WOLCO|nr:hypothetical protein WOLCODRAFT_168110 [Wolfiporia cocos MD-104 SS10]
MVNNTSDDWDDGDDASETPKASRNSRSTTTVDGEGNEDEGGTFGSALSSGRSTTTGGDDDDDEANSATASTDMQSINSNLSNLNDSLEAALPLNKRRRRKRSEHHASKSKALSHALSSITSSSSEPSAESCDGPSNSSERNSRRRRTPSIIYHYYEPGGRRSVERALFSSDPISISGNLRNVKGKGATLYTDPDNEGIDISRSDGGTGTKFMTVAPSAFDGNEVVPDNVTVTVPASKQDIARLEQGMALLEGRIITTMAQLVENLPLRPIGGSQPTIMPTTPNLPSAGVAHSFMHAMPRRRTAIPNLVISPRKTRHRPPSANKLQADVREYARHIMNRRDSSSPLRDPPSAEELVAYSRSGILNMTIDTFRVDFNGGAKSRWNAVAAEVFAEGFIASGWYECRDQERIQDAFMAHLKSLKSQYAEQQRGDDQDSPQKMHQRANNARNRRRISLFERRLDACHFHEDLHKFIPVLERMGKEGMSGDESDHQGGQRQYAIMRETWRNNTLLTKWLRILDLLQLHMKFNGMGRAARGNWPRIRKLSSTRPKLAGKPVAGLPLNFYDPEWYAALRDTQRAELGVQPQLDLTIPESMLRLAARYTNVAGSHCQPLDEDDAELDHLVALLWPNTSSE